MVADLVVSEDQGKAVDNADHDDRYYQAGQGE